MRWDWEQWGCGGHRVHAALGDAVGLVPFLLLGAIQASSVLMLLLPKLRHVQQKVRNHRKTCLLSSHPHPHFYPCDTDSREPLLQEGSVPHRHRETPHCYGEKGFRQKCSPSCSSHNVLHQTHTHYTEHRYTYRGVYVQNMAVGHSAAWRTPARLGRAQHLAAA